MDIYWYWPYLRPEHLALVDAVPRPGDTLVVHTIPDRIAPADRDRGAVRIEATLPEVGRERERSLRWFASRATTYPRRSRARAALARDGFDLAHVVFLNRLTDWYSLAPLGRRVPLVTTVHDVVPHETRLPAALERQLLARTYATAGEIVVHHPSIADRLASDFGIGRARLHEIAHWVLPSPHEARSRPSDRPTVLCFGAFRRNKGIDVLLDAIRRDRDLDATFVIAGRGAPEIEASVRAAAAADDRIRAEVGYVATERKHELYRACDLVVLPYTDFSSQSGVLHDAYAHGRPVVATDVGALGSSVRDDATGWVVAPGDPEAITAALRVALGDHDAWRAATAACERIRHERRPEAVGAAFAALYERTIAAR